LLIKIYTIHIQSLCKFKKYCLVTNQVNLHQDSWDQKWQYYISLNLTISI
jgi:hypothetical protein